VICMHMLRRPGSVPLNRGGLSTNRSNEQSIASKSPISRFLMVVLPRRLDECSRYALRALTLFK
jgi:hypothetical protein